MKLALHSVVFPKLRSTWEPKQKLGLGYLAAWLKREQPDVETVIAHTEEELFASGADLVGLTCVTYMIGYAREIAARVRRELGATVILGGPHVTTLPDRLDPEFDYAVLGEGEQTLGELTALLRRDAAPPLEALDEVRGILFRRDGRLVRTPPRPPIENLDLLPHPARDLFGGRTELEGGCISMMSSRGCPYKCSFCAATQVWPTWRAHSAEYVLAELDDVVARYNPASIEFEDDLLIADRKRFERIADGILARGYDKRLKFKISGRVNLLTEEVCDTLQRIGTERVFLGLESASDKTLQTLGKTGVTAARNEEALERLRRRGLRVVGAFIIGAPGGTHHDVYRTYEFVQRHLDEFDHVRGGLLRLLPGTEFWRIAEEKGLISEDLRGISLRPEDVDRGWEFFDRDCPMLNDTMRRETLMAFQLLFNEIERRVEERNAGRAAARENERLRTEIDALRDRDVRVLRIRSTFGALLRKLARRLVGKSSHLP